MNNNILTAREGYILTNGVTAGNIVALGKYDSPENWREIPVDEWEEIEGGEEM